MKINSKEIIYWTVSCLLLVSILTVFFSYPYYSVVFYDGEVDYFANIISAYVNGHSMDFLHPGFPIGYFSAFLISIFDRTDTVEEIILISRAGLLFLNLIFIYIGSRLISKQPFSSSFVLLFTLLLFPAGFLLVDHVSPNSILFGLSVLIISLGDAIGREYSKTKLILYSLFLGFAIAVKYTMLILVIPLLLAILFSNQSNENREDSKLSILSHLIMLTVFSFVFFCWPIVPFLPFVPSHHTSIGLLFDFLFSFNIYLLVFFFCFSMVFFFLLARKLLTPFTFLGIYKSISGVFLISLVLFSMYSFFINDSYEGVGISLRNFLPVLGMLVLFLPRDSRSKYSFLNNPYLIGFMISLLLMAKINFNIVSHQKAIMEDLDFSTFLEESSTNFDYLVFSPQSTFISKDLFLIWSDYRYGDVRKLYQEQVDKIPFTLNQRTNKIRIFNSRKFNLASPSNTTSFSYFNYIINNDIFTKSHKVIAQNQITSLYPKDLCLEPFEGYQRGKSALIIFPSSLMSYVKGNEVTKFDPAYKYINSLSKDFKEKCSLNNSINKVLYKDQQFYLLSLN